MLQLWWNATCVFELSIWWHFLQDTVLYPVVETGNLFGEKFNCKGKIQRLILKPTSENQTSSNEVPRNLYRNKRSEGWNFYFDTGAQVLTFLEQFYKKCLPASKLSDTYFKDPWTFRRFHILDTLNFVYEFKILYIQMLEWL